MQRSNIRLYYSQFVPTVENIRIVSYSEYLTFAVGSNVPMYCTYTYITHAHKDEGGVDQVTLQYLRAFEFDDLLPPFMIQIAS